MELNTALQKLKEYEKRSFALYHASGLMYYDGATTAPKGSAGVRAITLGELSRMSYELTTAKDSIEMLECLMAHSDELDPVTRRKASELYRDYERTHKIPIDEFVAYQQLCSEADSVWHDAKAASEFSMFEPYLQKMFDSTKRIALYMEPGKHPYETMLDTYERGLTIAACDEFFDTLKKRLVPLMHRVAERGDRVNDAPLRQNFPIAKQRELSDYLMDVIGIDRNHCILGETEHPFTTDFSKYDVRITTHYYEDKFASSMYSVIHEGGHALYELHTGDELACSNLGRGVSMAIHESQSRFYENIIGRSREFCGLIFPFVKKEFCPLLNDVSAAECYRMINNTSPSRVRTEADELTYCLHIMIRYRLERAMFDGSITARDLPHEWNRLYKEYLGIDVPSDKYGVLQDSHWANGNIGYFPSYAIGSAYGAQYYKAMNRDFDVKAAISAGELGKINSWLQDKIWKYGCMKDPVALFESVCGRFDPSCYGDYLANKFTEIYGL